MALLAVLEATFNRVGMVSIQAVAVVVLILVIQRLFRRVLTPAWRYALWTVLVARLVLLWAPEAPWSMFNAARSMPAISFEQSAQERQTAFEPAAPERSEAQRYFAAMNLDASKNLAHFDPVAGRSADTSPTSAYQLASSSQGAMREGLTVAHLLRVVWLSGVAIALCLFGIQSRRGGRLCHDAVPVTSNEIQRLLRQCCGDIGLSWMPAVCERAGVASPMVTGIWRPKLLLPLGFIDQAPREQLRLVFLHELTHLRRRDLWWDLPIYGLLAIHWFNPVLWWAAYRIVCDRELACDAAVLQRLSPADRNAYGHALLDMFQRFREPRWAPGLAAIAEKRGLLERRIAMITGFSGVPRWAMAVGVAALSGLAAVSLTNAQLRGETKPDVSIAQPDVWASTGEGQHLQLVARVHNHGSDPTVTAVRFLDKVESGEQQQLGEVMIDVPGNGEAIGKINWPAAYGVHSITVAIDPDGELAEADETNNTTTRTIAYAHGRFIHENMLTDDLSQYDTYVPNPQVLGLWTSVDFVDTPDDFTPGNKRWRGDLYLEGMEFSEEGGRGQVTMMKGAYFPFTKGVVLHPGDQTASKYEIRSIDGQDYMFFEWKSGDVTIRHSAPKYYVLARAAGGQAPKNAQAIEYETHPGYPLLQEAEGLYQAGQYDEAIGAYERVYQSYPDWNYAETALMMIGIIKGRQGKLDEAPQWLKKATDEYDIPGWMGTTWFYLGEAYVQANRNDEARAAFAQAVALLEEQGDTRNFAYLGSKKRLNEIRGTQSSSLRPRVGDASEVAVQLSSIREKVEQVQIGVDTIDDVVRKLGEPTGHVGDCLIFAGGIQAYVPRGIVDEIRFETSESGYKFRGKIGVGSTLEEVIAVLGAPTATVVGRNDFNDGVLYQDINGRVGWGYYARSDQGVRMFLTNNRVNALYLTRTAGNGHGRDRTDSASEVYVKGRVVGEQSNRPIKYSSVTCEANNGQAFKDIQDWPYDGVFDIRLPAPGEYTLHWRSLLAPETPDTSRRQTITVADGETKELDLTLPEPWSMSVRLVDENGNPVRATIGPWYMQADGTPFRYGGYETDENGRFELGDFMPGVRSGFNNDVVEGYSPIQDEGLVGQAGETYPERTFVMASLGGHLTGRIVTETGVPIPKQPLFIGSTYGDGNRAMQLGQSDSAGRFDCAIGRKGEPFTLTLRNNGGPRSLHWTKDQIVVGADETVDLGDIVLTDSSS